MESSPDPIERAAQAEALVRLLSVVEQRLERIHDFTGTGQLQVTFIEESREPLLWFSKEFLPDILDDDDMVNALATQMGLSKNTEFNRQNFKLIEDHISAVAAQEYDFEDTFAPTDLSLSMKLIESLKKLFE